MKCDCGNENAYRMRFWHGGHCCDECGGLGAQALPDVFFKQPYLDPHLIDVNDPKQKNGVWIESKEQKKRIMDKLRVKEAGDRFHGARQEFRPMQGGWKV